MIERYFYNGNTNMLKQPKICQSCGHNPDTLMELNFHKKICSLIGEQKPLSLACQHKNNVIKTARIRFRRLETNVPNEAKIEKQVLAFVEGIPSTVMKALRKRGLSVDETEELDFSELLKHGWGFPFEIFPPGTHLKGSGFDVNVRKKRSRYSDLKLEVLENRYLKLCDKLDVTNVMIGRKGWDGYYVYLFKRYSSVVLDCQHKGNAAYIFPAEWFDLISFSRFEIRQNFTRGKDYQIVNHVTDWTERVEEALVKLNSL